LAFKIIPAAYLYLLLCHSVLDIADVYFAEQMYGIHKNRWIPAIVKSRRLYGTGMTIRVRFRNWNLFLCWYKHVNPYIIGENITTMEGCDDANR
jgi:hypothetical protein